jgi:hypothetical protein
MPLMSRAVAAAVVTVTVCLLAAQRVVADESTFDCKMKQLGLDFAQAIQPFRPTSTFQVREATSSFFLSPLSVVGTCLLRRLSPPNYKPPPSFLLPS